MSLALHQEANKFTCNAALHWHTENDVDFKVSA